MTTIVLQPGCYYVADSLYGLFNYEKASATTRSFWEMTTKDGIVKEMDGIICLDIEVDTRSSAGAYFSGELYIVNHDLVQLTPKGIDCLRFSESVEAVITSTTESDEVVLSVSCGEYTVRVFKADDYDESSDDYYSSDDEDEPEPEPEASSDYQDSDK